MWKTELLILYVKSPLQPHTFVVGLDREYFLGFVVKPILVIKVFCTEDEWQIVSVYHIGGVGEEEV